MPRMRSVWLRGQTDVRLRDAKGGIALHALEDDARLFRCLVDDALARGGEDDVRRTACGVGSVPGKRWNTRCQSGSPFSSTSL